MYLIPQDYKCRKCAAVFKWSGQDAPIPFCWAPYCPSCLEKWFDENLPIGDRVINPPDADPCKG